MFDHINVTLFILELALLSWLVSGLDYLHLFDIFISWTLKATLQKIPEYQIDYSIKYEDNCE